MWRRRGLRDGLYRVTPDMPPRFVVHLLAFMSPCTTVARADAVRRWGGFFDRDRCRYGEDAFLWLKFLLNETVSVQLAPLVRFHAEASALSGNLSGPRPVEPKLVYPGEIEAACPEELRPLLADVLALRAMKTACVLSYWGRWREARGLLRRFCPWSRWRLRGFAVAQAASTPLGSAAGELIRRVRRLSAQPTLSAAGS
jgi:hypothetical protein